MKKTLKKIKATLTQVDITLVINAMKNVFPTKEEVNNKLQFVPSWASIDQRLDELLTKEEFNKKISILPTKDDFAVRMDKLSKEYEKIDQAETLHGGRLSEQNETLEHLDERVSVLEKRHASNPSPAVAD